MQSRQPHAFTFGQLENSVPSPMFPLWRRAQVGDKGPVTASSTSTGSTNCLLHSDSSSFFSGQVRPNRWNVLVSPGTGWLKGSHFQEMARVLPGRLTTGAALDSGCSSSTEGGLILIVTQAHLLGTAKPREDIPC